MFKLDLHRHTHSYTCAHRNLMSGEINKWRSNFLCSFEVSQIFVLIGWCRETYWSDLIETKVIVAFGGRFVPFAYDERSRKHKNFSNSRTCALRTLYMAYGDGDMVVCICIVVSGTRTMYRKRCDRNENVEKEKKTNTKYTDASFPAFLLRSHSIRSACDASARSYCAAMRARGNWWGTAHSVCVVCRTSLLMI